MKQRNFSQTHQYFLLCFLFVLIILEILYSQSFANVPLPIFNSYSSKKNFFSLFICNLSWLFRVNEDAKFYFIFFSKCPLFLTIILCPLPQQLLLLYYTTSNSYRQGASDRQNHMSSLFLSHLSPAFQNLFVTDFSLEKIPGTWNLLQPCFRAKLKI